MMKNYYFNKQINNNLVCCADENTQKSQNKDKKIKIFVKIKSLILKLRNCKFVIHPLFLLVGLFCFLVGQGFIFCCYTLCVFLHELAHMIVAKKLGYICNKIKLMPFGAVLDAESDEFSYKDEILIAVVGPLTNILLCLICVTLWWINPATYYITCDFAVANLVCGLFNLLPIFPLDGGRVLLAFISINHDRKFSVKIVKIVTICFGFILFGLFILTFFKNFNLSLGIMGFTLVFSAFSEDKNTTYKRIIALPIKRKKLKHGLQTKILMIDKNQSLRNVYMKLSFNHYNFVYVCDENFKILHVLDENKINMLLDKFGNNAKLIDII